MYFRCLLVIVVLFSIHAKALADGMPDAVKVVYTKVLNPKNIIGKNGVAVVKQLSESCVLVSVNDLGDDLSAMDKVFKCNVAGDEFYFGYTVRYDKHYVKIINSFDITASQKYHAEVLRMLKNTNGKGMFNPAQKSYYWESSYVRNYSGSYPFSLTLSSSKNNSDILNVRIDELTGTEP